MSYNVNEVQLTLHHQRIRLSKSHEISPYKSEENIPNPFLEKLEKSKIQLEKEKELYEKARQEEINNDLQNEQKQNLMINQINELIYPLKIAVHEGKSWNGVQFETEVSIVLISTIKNIYPRYLCRKNTLLYDLPILLESS